MLYPPALPDVRVLVFVLSDCPIARRYSPELARIAATPHATMTVVFEDRELTGKQAQAHLRSFGLSVNAVVDGSGKLAKRYGIDTVPTAVVLRNGKVWYVGRIDDRYAALGAEHPPRRHDVREALSAAALGKPFPKPWHHAVGCLLGD